MAEGLLGTEERLPSSAVVGGPVASKSKQGGVYVASANCKLYELDRAGKIRRWYQLGGIPADFPGDTPQFVDGILYVLVAIPNWSKLVDGPSDVCVKDDPRLEIERYECPSAPYQGSGFGCNYCITIVYWIYAFKME